ncbi:hypothetical protein RI570_06610 [Brucella pseudogrignonensis]|uniref:hypothetical protein n=1 Tax=Brucella pseudogrignonensis TaxID=419475 RepID=UPI0028B5695D|nr:hypothetical protein [Brucella pseudogrignonensis]MDT6939815.1 hypothetical protein [Brucella pseudogrignonensis]
MSFSLKSQNPKLQKLMQRKAKIESELSRLEKSEKTAARKLDSRRKIVLGSALLKAISEGRIQDSFARNLIASFAAERDKVIFDDFTFDVPGVGVANAQEE